MSGKKNAPVQKNTLMSFFKVAPKSETSPTAAAPAASPSPATTVPTPPPQAAITPAIPAPVAPCLFSPAAEIPSVSPQVAMPSKFEEQVDDDEEDGPISIAQLKARKAAMLAASAPQPSAALASKPPTVSPMANLGSFIAKSASGEKPAPPKPSQTSGGATSSSKRKGETISSAGKTGKKARVSDDDAEESGYDDGDDEEGDDDEEEEDEEEEDDFLDEDEGGAKKRKGGKGKPVPAASQKKKSLSGKAGVEGEPGADDDGLDEDGRKRILPAGSHDHNKW